MSKVTALYHIVFCTRCRRMSIPLEYKEDLYRFIWKECTDEFNSKLLRIGGIQNHVHLLVNLHPSVSLQISLRISRLIQAGGWLKISDFVVLTDGQKGISRKASLPEINKGLLSTSSIRKATIYPVISIRNYICFTTWPDSSLTIVI